MAYECPGCSEDISRDNLKQDSSKEETTLTCPECGYEGPIPEWRGVDFDKHNSGSDDWHWES